jgi:hypothetical protein
VTEKVRSPHHLCGKNFHGSPIGVLDRSWLMFTRTGADASRVTSNRRLHRLTAFAAVSMLFGITSTVSALASQQEIAPVAAPVAVVTNVDAVEDAALSHATAARFSHPVVVRTARATPVKAVAKPVVVKKAVATKPKAAKATTSTRATVRKTTTTAVAATHVVSAKVRTITRYTDAPGSQKAIDSCKLVLWTRSPLWLAGHNWCGWQWMAYVPTGSTVRVTSGAAAGTYVVTGHLRLSRQSGSLPRVKADLVLQTCIGSGTGLTLLRRV